MAQYDEKNEHKRGTLGLDLKILDRFQYRICKLQTTAVDWHVRRDKNWSARFDW